MRDFIEDLIALTFLGAGCYMLIVIAGVLS